MAPLKADRLQGDLFIDAQDARTAIFSYKAPRKTVKTQLFYRKSLPLNQAAEVRQHDTTTTLKNFLQQTKPCLWRRHFRYGVISDTAAPCVS